MKPYYLIFAAVLIAAGHVYADSPATGYDIIPRPKTVKIEKGVFHLAPSNSNVTTKVTGTGEPESYTLDIRPDNARIVAADSAGLFYGIKTLEQLAENGGTDGIACQRIDDAPRFPYRGLMFDVSRHFRSVEFLKKQIDAMSALKLNHAHIHLTDAAGWRLQVDKYPRLTEYAAWRPQRRWTDWIANGANYCECSDPDAYGGFYTKAELRDLVDYAAKRHITIIPEIEMPGHSDEVVAAYPEISCNGTGGDLCPGKEETFEFLQAVLDETMEIFPSKLIHIGGDEASKEAWKNCPDCIRRMETENLKDVDELQNYLINRIERYVNAHGRSIIGWDEILEGQLAPTAAVMSWRGTDGGIKALNSGHDVIMTPGSYAYLDYCQDAPFREPSSIGGYIPLSRTYSYEPLESTVVREKAKHLKGVQGNLWVEYITEDSHAEYMYYPRAYAIAEIGWSSNEKNYEDFHRRALTFNDNMKAKGYNVFDLRNEYGQRRQSLEPLNHLARGKKVIYNIPYNSSYTAGGDTALVDGIRAGWMHSDGRWQGFLRGFDVTVDLGKVQPIHYVGASFMHSEGAWIHFPEKMTVSVSDDGFNYNEIATIYNDVDPKYNKIMVKDYGSVVEATCRYVRVEATKNPRRGAWIFIDELVVN